MTNVTVLYASVTELRDILSGTDATGTAAMLSPSQLTQALTSASNTVSAYVGTVFDVTQNADFVPPVMLHDLALDLATWWASVTYLKFKEMGPNSPIVLKYTHAMKLLEDIRDGRVRVDPDVPGSPGGETGHVVNPLLPNGATNVFSFENSNTSVNLASGYLEAGTPADLYQGSLLNDWDGPVYQ